MNKHKNVIIGGIVATLAMTMLMLVAPMMGMPKMNTGEMLGGMMGGSVILGWMMHFVIGIIFAYAYLYLLNKKLPVANNYLRGVIYGFIVFIFAQIIMAMMGAMGMAPEMPNENMAMMIVGSIMGHLVYGTVLGAFIKKEN